MEVLDKAVLFLTNTNSQRRQLLRSSFGYLLQNG